VIFSSLFVWLFALWSAFASPAPAVVEPAPVPAVVQPAPVSGFFTAPEAPPAPAGQLPPGCPGAAGCPGPAATPDGGLPDPAPSQVIPDGQLVAPSLDCDESGCADD
jgi:hypothetical protein